MLLQHASSKTLYKKAPFRHTKRETPAAPPCADNDNLSTYNTTAHGGADTNNYSQLSALLNDDCQSGLVVRSGGNVLDFPDREHGRGVQHLSMYRTAAAAAKFSGRTADAFPFATRVVRVGV